MAGTGNLLNRNEEPIGPSMRKISLQPIQLPGIRTQFFVGFGLILSLTFIVVLINLVAINNPEPPLVSTTRATIIIGIAIFVIGVLTAFILAWQMLVPFDSLTRAARKIGGGDIDQSVAVSGRGEFASLVTTFNEMAAQLRTRFASLEQLVTDRTHELAVSFEISRRLSTILNRKRLTLEVAELVRSAFDYYHAQIYG